MARVLVAEDDALQRDLVQQYLIREGHQVQAVGDGAVALDLAARTAPDLLVLDLMMPGLDGLAVCRRLRDAGAVVPVLMLTARATENDLLLGLELGADEYLTKPYSPRELVARVRALLRRARMTGGEDQVVQVGDIRLDSRAREVVVCGRPVELTAMEFDLLQAFMRAPGAVLSREQLLERVHGFDRYITPRTIDVHVKNLRSKIEAEPAQPRVILTVFGVGYRLAAGASVPDAP